jgi:nitrogen regulatory protein P-II 2
VDFLPKIKLEVAVDENLLEQVVEMVVSAARTEKIGDGKIFVTDIEEVVRIRTGQTGAEAL